MSKLIPHELFPILIKRRVISVFYHVVSDDELPHVRHLYPVVSISEFTDALNYLESRYSFVSYHQLQDKFVNGTPLPQNAVHLSFDDGFAECFSIVRPILLEKNIPCTFFLTIDWLDNQMLYFRHKISLCVSVVKKLNSNQKKVFLEKINVQLGTSHHNVSAFTNWLMEFREDDTETIKVICRFLGINPQKYLDQVQPYLTRNQIKQMHNEGFTIGAHGVTHRKLGFISENSMEQEIVGSCITIMDITGQEIVPFSFPQSAGNIDRSWLAELLDRNPSIGILFDTKDLRKERDFMINRIWAERPISPDRILHPLPVIFNYAYQDAWVDSLIKSLTK